MSHLIRVVAVLLLVALSLASFAPVVSVILAGLVATAFDCRLGERPASPCLVGGVDIGGTLLLADTLGWLMFLTWPGMLVSVWIWTWILVRWHRARRR